MSNIQEKAEQYAREKLGDWGSVVHSAYEINECTNCEISVQDYTAGYKEAKRWIPVGERLPEYEIDGDINVVLVRFTKAKFPMTARYDNITSKWHMYGTLIEIDVIEWREI